MEFSELLDKYRKNAFSKSDLGTKFEELMVGYLKTDPKYAPQFEWVKLWRNFPARDELGGQDTGIDIVAKTNSGEYWAIQCKFYSEDHRVSKADMDTFLSTSGRKFHDESGSETSFSQRIVIATTDNWGENALEASHDQTIPVSLIHLSDLNDAPVDWESIEQGIHGSSARKEKHTLFDHQREALERAVEHYKTHDRGRMIMACGTGKTFTSLKIAETLVNNSTDNTMPNGCHKGSVLFLAPSISLVGQTLREWTSNSENDLNPICVCSDPQVSKRRTEDDIGERVEDLGMPATTDPLRILSQYNSNDNLAVVFSTYQSIDAIIEAQNRGLPDFDLIICDEAHRTTGVIMDGGGGSESYFTKVHSNDNVRAKKRLYMTATPRIYGVKGKEDAQKASVTLCSMDEESIYGDEFYKITFGRAVELELLSDYKVLILTTKADDVPDIIKRHWTNGGKEIDVDTDCKIWGCLHALAKDVADDETLRNADPDAMTRAVAFSRTIYRSKTLTDRFNELANLEMSPIKLKMQHIDGSMNSMGREERMNWLKKESDECRVLSNVRCLCEGVDVPALDAVMFLDSKGSLIDVVQSVGRVMRKSEGKRYGYVIIPIVVPDDEDPESALDDNERYKVVWQVLRALRSHDERLAAEINTFQYKKNNRNGHIHIDRPSKSNMGDVELFELTSGQYSLDDFGDALLARLVLKVGDREYIENWAKNVAGVMPALMERLRQICECNEYGYKQYKPAFKRYLKGLRSCVNDNVSEEDAINMLAQQIVTKPIFQRLFGGEGFVMQNSVSQTIDAMLQEIDAKNGLEDINEQLQDFYRSVELTLSGIETADGKQKVITSLYEKFFKNAFPKDQSINGVVYTPQEIVDFIIRSARDVLKQEFNLDINDNNINILDPFTGTGTFIARLIETGIINKENLERKYLNELFANEITLLAYYIAAVNIENTFARVTGSEEYISFENILLTDTFNINQICNQTTVQTDLYNTEYFKRNKKRIQREHDSPITIILGNPPYGANQKSANDNAKKRKYKEGVDKDIEEKYLDDLLFDEKKGNVNSVYDNYIRAFRWSTDRIGNNDGIIAFVTPNGWLTGSAFVGFRKCIEKEFSKAYVFNLRGDGAGRYKLEGDNVFVYGTNRGCKTGIAITLLVKHKDFNGRLKAYYKDIMTMGKGYHVLEKRKTISDCVSFKQMETNNNLEVLNIKDNGDWIIERNENFKKLIPLAGDTHRKFEKHDEETVFVGYTNGYKTNRDIWSYNFSKELVANNMKNMVDEYNRQTENNEQIFDSTKIAWSGSLDTCFKRGDKAIFDIEKIRQSVYRPFSRRWFYSDSMFIEGVYQNPKIFPTPDTENKLICVSGVGVKKEFSCIITDRTTDVQLMSNGQCFPIYWYENKAGERAKNKLQSLFEDSVDIVKHDGISDYALNLAREKYGFNVTKEDIFYYVYGYLHSPDYRKLFSDDLKLSLPRIDFVSNLDDFFAFSNAGRELANLHLNYENLAPPDTLTISGIPSIDEALSNPKLCRVNKMKLIPEERKLIYNQYITIENIPEEAFEYVANGRSALGWLVEQYQYSVDKDSGIVNDPNEYAGGDYILKLVLSVIGVSVKTMEIVKQLPSLDIRTV